MIDPQWSTRCVIQRLDFLNVTSKLGVDQGIKYTGLILKCLRINIFRVLLLDFKETAKESFGYQCTFRSAKVIVMEDNWVWAKAYGLDTYGDPIIGGDCCEKFEKEFGFDLGNRMWRKHRDALQARVK